MDCHKILVMAFLYYIECYLAIKTTVYIKTNVIQDKCSSSRMGVKISTRSVLSCSIRCSSNTNCWRYMVCPDTTGGKLRTCEMYTDGQSCIVPEGTGAGCKCYMKKSSCVDGSCDCAMGYHGAYCDSVIRDCIQGQAIFPTVKSAMAFIQPDSSVEPFEVFCDFESGLSTFHNRDRSCSDINFNRTYSEYVAGFGNAYTNYWLGLKRIKLLLDIVANPKIDIMLITTSDSFKQAVYKNVVVGETSTNYRFSATKAWGDLTDALFMNPNTSNSAFSTFDRDNTTYHCPSTYGGGWWFADHPDCCNANLNGPQEELSWDDNFAGSIKRVFMRVGNI